MTNIVFFATDISSSTTYVIETDDSVSIARVFEIIKLKTNLKDFKLKTGIKNLLVHDPTSLIELGIRAGSTIFIMD